MPDLRKLIQTSLASIQSEPLRDASLGLLQTLGYESDRTLELGDSSPAAFLDFITSSPQGDAFDSKKSALLRLDLRRRPLPAHRRRPRPPLCRPFRAQSRPTRKPRALPWAGMVRTVGAEEAKQRDFLTQFHAALNAAAHPIRQRLDRICIASPDLLAVIRKEDGYEPITHMGES